MSNNNNNQENRDEIDLREVFKYIGDFFITIGNWIISGILYFRKATAKNIILISIITLVSVGVGFLSVKTQDPSYKSSLLLQSGYLNTRTIEVIIDKLNQLKSDSLSGGLSTALGFEKEKADAIILFEFEPFVTEEEVIELELLKNDLTDAKLGEEVANRLIKQIQSLNRGTFAVSVTTSDPLAVVGLDSSITQYIQSLPFVRKRIEANRNRDLARLKKINEEIPKIDSLRDILTKHLKEVSSSRKSGSNNVILGTDDVPSPLTAYNQAMQLNNEKLNLERSLFLKSDFELIDGFTPSFNPENDSIKQNLVYSILIGLAISYLLIFLFQINKWLTVKEKEFEGKEE